ncbi:MAG: helix-turn-helix domain-containing protein [Sphaerochaetaceae bacterium]
MVAFVPSSEYNYPMDYISVKEAAKAWGISERRVRSLCADGRIEGAARHGDWAWSIPVTTARPIDGRALRFIKNESFRTGAQNYTDADQMKGMPSTAASINDSILLGLDIDGISASIQQVCSIASGSLVPSLALPVHIMICNASTVLSDPPEAITEYSIRQCNCSILRSADNSSRGEYSSKEAQHEFATLMLQYSKDWSALHPLARASFLFGELLRIKPFSKANGLTSVCMMQSSLREAGYPMADFPPICIQELMAALAATGKRGNYQAFVSLLCNAVARKQK